MTGGRALAAALFGRRWWWTTLLALLGMALLVRLGGWQLDRLEQRRARNTVLAAQIAQPPLELSAGALPADGASLGDRTGMATGRFDFSQQVALTQQLWQGAVGFHLVTPLVLGDGRTAVLVDRGWVPQHFIGREAWAQFDEPDVVTVVGEIQLSQGRPGDGAEAGGGPQSTWFRVDIERLAAQMPFELLPVYLKQRPAGERQGPPFRAEAVVDLSDGPHLGYAVQWFLFAAVLGVGYVAYVRRHDGEAG